MSYLSWEMNHTWEPHIQAWQAGQQLSKAHTEQVPLQQPGTSTSHPAGEEGLGPPSSSFISWVITHNWGSHGSECERVCLAPPCCSPRPWLSSKAQGLGWCINEQVLVA